MKLRIPLDKSAVFRYFFMVMAGLIVIGLLNGLILLPVVLSLIGPPTEVCNVFLILLLLKV